MLSKLFKRTVQEFRPVYNELYYLSKDLNFFQRRTMYKWFWNALKKECKKDIRTAKKMEKAAKKEMTDPNN